MSNFLHRRPLQFDIQLVLLVGGLTIFGLLMLMSASSPIAAQHANDTYYFVKRQIWFGFLPGIIGFFSFASVDYRCWRKLALPALFVSILLLVSVYLPGIGQEIGGSRSWIRFGSFQFQPSEIVKLSFLIYLSAWLANKNHAETRDVQSSLFPFLGSLGLVMLLLIYQPDTGSMVVIMCMSLLLYFLSGPPITWFFGICIAAFTSLVLLIKSSPYRAARLMTYLNREIDPKGVGYHIHQAILAIGSGGWFGLGYGHSRQKYLYLPEVQSDSIGAVVAEEMGFLVMGLLLFAMAMVVWKCFSIARNTKDPFGANIAMGVGTWIWLETLLNLGSMTGLLPMTGVTLPFISYGGTAMTALLSAMGIVTSMTAKDG